MKCEGFLITSEAEGKLRFVHTSRLLPLPKKRIVRSHEKVMLEITEIVWGEKCGEIPCHTVCFGLFLGDLFLFLLSLGVFFYF